MTTLRPDRRGRPNGGVPGKLWAGRIALVLAAPLLLFGLVEFFAWSIGIEPAKFSKAHLNRKAIDDCRWHPEHIETHCARKIRPPDGTRRVYVLGASSVAGHPWGETRNIPHFIGDQLDAHHPGEYEVISLATTCKDSYYVRQCAEKAIDTRPEAIVVYSGHNDFSGFMSRWPGLLMWIERSGWWVIELQRMLAHTRAWTLINPRAVEPLEFAYDPGANLDPPGVARAYARILEGYEENLERILERARDKEITVIWVTPVGNLSEYPVRKKNWALVGLQNNQAGKDAKPWVLEYSQGIIAFREQRFDDAIAAFKRARDHFPRTRAPALLNERLRELDAGHSDFHLVDFEAQLEKLGREEGIGCTFFGTEEYCDGIHPNPRTSRLIGESVAERIVELRKGRP